MAGKLRELRQRIRSVSTIKKTTRAMELVAGSRIRRARERSAAAAPYARELSRAVSALVTYSNVQHALTTERENPTRAAMLLITSDRGLAGAYSANIIREGERLAELLRDEGKEVLPYLCGRKASAYYRFRNREVAGEWTGFSDNPQYADAKRVGQTLIDAFGKGGDDGGVDEIHIVYTQFVSMMTQRPEVIRLLPLEIVEEDETGSASDAGGSGGSERADLLPLYEFEPEAEEVLDVLLPRYVESRIHSCMLQAAASELAARQRAMKSATDNADELITLFTRQLNQARQAEVTQEISEIVGGANALADATAGSE